MTNPSTDTQLTGESGKLDEMKHILNSLAKELSTNYCTASFGDGDKGKVKLNELFEDQSGEKTVGDADLKHRNILVIGGGATHDSYKCIPLGKGITEKLKELNPSIDEKLIKDRFNQTSKELVPGWEEKEPDFENKLSLLTQWYYTPLDLREAISNLVAFKYPPSLFYEIIAHLFKHSFIDVIVNFNFDELLDNAIEEELGHENYYHILSDGDCVSIDQIMIDGRIKVPVYIKPHGTFKHKSSLRFTHRHYLEMPAPVKELLEKLVGGKTQPANTKSGKDDTELAGSKLVEDLPVPPNLGREGIRVNLICVGFNLESMEFNDILNKHLPSDSKIYHFVKEKEDPRCKNNPLFLKNVLPDFYKSTGGSGPEKATIDEDEKTEHDSIYHRIALDSLGSEPGNRLTTPLAEIFSYVWRRVYYQFNENFRPRSIGHHEIMSYLFYDAEYGAITEGKEKQLKQQYTIEEKDNSDENDNTDGEAYEYFLDRTLVEIAISINRNNGVAELAQLLGDRPGKYFALYKTAKSAFDKRRKEKDKSYKEQSLSIYQLIDEFKNKKDDNSFYPKGIFQLDTTVLREPKIEDENCEFLKIFRKKFDQIPSVKYPRNKKCDRIAPAVLYYLFTSKQLSEGFKENFIANHSKIVYNGKQYDSKKLKKLRIPSITQNSLQTGLKMIDELVRLFDKSGAASISYFSIHPRFNNPHNFLIESFTKSSILHTNLALEYKFREFFREDEEVNNFEKWNHLLIISEKVSLLDFLKDNNNGSKNFDGKKITIINCYEAIKQFYPQLDGYYKKQVSHYKKEIKNNADFKGQNAEKLAFAAKITELNKLRTEEYKNSIKHLNNDENIDIEVSCLPAAQHNHHMMVFINNRKITNQSSEKSPHFIRYKNKSKNKIVYKLDMIGALYMYRQGFSNSINPIFISGDDNNDDSVTNDFKRLLRIFSKIYGRAKLFKSLPESEDLDFDFINELDDMFISSSNKKS